MWYFAYGSNMNPERMRKRGVDFKQRRKGILRGYCLVFNKIATGFPGAGYANIVPDESGLVEGILYEVEKDDIENKLDRYEGYPVHYKTYEMKVELEDGTEVDATVYVASEEYVAEGLMPTRDYLDHLLKGSDLLSEDYRAWLANHQTID